MKIEDLKNQKIKISARSITCKNENRKTVGVVTGATSFKNLRPNIQSEFFGKIKTAGIWSSGEVDKVYYCDGKIYYLFDLQPLEAYEKYFSGKSGFDAEAQRYNQRKQLAESAAKVMSVIPCYIIK